MQSGKGQDNYIQFVLQVKEKGCGGSESTSVGKMIKMCSIVRAHG